MQVTETLSEGLKRAYTVRLAAEDLAGERARKLADIGRTIRMPGFRPGKVPQSLLQKRYGPAIMAEVLQDAVNTATDRLMSDRGLRPARQPQVDLVGAPAPDATADVEFKVELEVLPEITIPDLAGLSLVRLRATPTDEAVAARLQALAESRPLYDEVPEDRGAEAGDTLVIDFMGTRDGAKFGGGEGTDTPVEIGGTGFIPGFAEQLAGMRRGETRTFDVTFPDPYHAPDLSGQTARFEVTAKALKIRRPAVLDDAFAETLGFETADEMRGFVRDSLQRDYDGMARMKLKRELLDELALRAQFPVPESLISAEFDAIWQRVEADRAAGQVDEEDRDKDPDALRAEYRAIADRRVRLGLLLAEIGRTAGIAVTQDELGQALRREVSQYPGQESRVIDFFRKNPAAVEQLRGPIFEDKVVDYILELASVEDREATPEELALPPAPAAAGETPAQASGDEPG